MNSHKSLSQATRSACMMGVQHRPSMADRSRIRIRQSLAYLFSASIGLASLGATSPDAALAKGEGSKVRPSKQTAGMNSGNIMPPAPKPSKQTAGMNSGNTDSTAPKPSKQLAGMNSGATSTPIEAEDSKTPEAEARKRAEFGGVLP